ncbi:hypothetical protein D3C80_1730200 [compost metagenome]
MFGTVVVSRDFCLVGDVQRGAVLVLAGGMWVGQGFLSQRGDARGLVVIVALCDFFLGAGQHLFAFVAA